MRGFNTEYGIRLTHVYDVQFKDIENHIQTKVTKVHILWYMGWKFCMKFQMWPLKFHTEFETMHRKICILRGIKSLANYDILELCFKF